MVRLIEALVPRILHRAILNIVYPIRRRWRKFRKSPLAGVSVIATDKAGRVLLVRHSYGPNVWALPGGGSKPGEDPIAAARREMQEEIGCFGDDAKILAVFEEEISGSPHTAHIVTVTLARDVKIDNREIIEASYFARDEIPGQLGRLARERLNYWLSQQR